MNYKGKPQIKLFKFINNKFELQAIIDDYQECSFEHSLYSAGIFTISINYNIPNANLFQRGLFIQFGNDSKSFGEIIKITDSISSDGKGSQIRIIEGYDSRYLLKKRIIKNLNYNGKWELTGKGEFVLRKLIQDQCGFTCNEEKRKLPFENGIKINNSFLQAESPITTSWWGLAYSENLNLFVATGASGFKIATSPDGVEWTVRPNPVSSAVTGALTAIIYSEEKNLFVAAGDNSVILTSPDGINWTQQTVNVISNFRGVTWCKEKELFIVSGINGIIMSSPDGVEWTVRYSGTSTNVRKVVYSEKLDLFVAVGTGGTIITSSDLENWTQRESHTTNFLYSLEYSEEKNLFVTVGNAGVILISEDGINWKIVAQNNQKYLVEVKYFPELNLFISVGEDRFYCVSSDGINWQNYILEATPVRGTNDLRSICHSKFYNKLVIVGYNSQLFMSMDSESSDNVGVECFISEAYSNLYDVCETVCTQNEIGWNLKFKDSKLTLEFSNKKDKSDTIKFSPSYDSISDGSFVDSSESFSNVTYIGGQGQNNDRDIYEGEALIEDNSPFGLERYESWSDKRDITTYEEFENQANQLLNQYTQTISVQANGLSKSPYIFRRDYDVGDIITVEFSGKSSKVEILSVVECWSHGNYELQFSVGKPQMSLNSQLQLLLRKIQNASEKTDNTQSVKWYDIEKSNSMPAEDVKCNTLGFTGQIYDEEFEFILYFNKDENLINATGSKTYTIYRKQLSGDGYLVLTTGIEGTEKVYFRLGEDAVSSIYVDNFGNVFEL